MSCTSEATYRISLVTEATKHETKRHAAAFAQACGGSRVKPYRMIVADCQSLNRSRNIAPVADTGSNERGAHPRASTFLSHHLVHLQLVPGSRIAQSREDFWAQLLVQMTSLLVNPAISALHGSRIRVHARTHPHRVETHTAAPTSTRDRRAAEAILVAWSDGEVDGQVQWAMNPKDKITPRRWTSPPPFSSGARRAPDDVDPVQKITSWGRSHLKSTGLGTV